MASRGLLRIVVIGSALGASLVGVGVRVAPGAAPPPVHGAIVPETPVAGWPRIINGSVDAAERVGAADGPRTGRVTVTWAYL